MFVWWQLSIKLKAKLEQRAKDGDKAFAEFGLKHAMELCEAPGGTELVQMVGYVYGLEGKQYAGRFLGFEGFFAQIQEKAHVVSSGAAVLADAVKTANMANEVGDRQRGGSSEVTSPISPARHPRHAYPLCRILAPSAPLPLAGAVVLYRWALVECPIRRLRTESPRDLTLPVAATSFDRRFRHLQADEVRRQELEKKMMKSGLNVVWKMGKLMLEERCRKICEIMMSGVDKDRSKVESLAHALIQASTSKTWSGLHCLSPALPLLSCRITSMPSPLLVLCLCLASSRTLLSLLCGIQLGEIFEKVGLREEKNQQAAAKALGADRSGPGGGAGAAFGL